MASYVAPKTNWAPSDGIANTDLNRIEENTEALMDNVVWMSSHLASSAKSVDSSGWDIQSISVLLPVQTKLMLRNLRYYIGNTSGDLRVKVSDVAGGAYTTPDDAGEVTPLTTLASNTSGVPTLRRILVEFLSVAAPDTADKESGFSLQMEIQDF